jgi:hypothetical protein
MNTRQIRFLTIALVVLLAVLFTTRLSDNQVDSSAGSLLFPELKSEINDVSELRIAKGGDVVTITNVSGTWALRERTDYPVDTGKLRQLLLALANAKKLEEKTSNPDMYERLGVGDPGEDSQGTEIRISGPDDERSLIVGNLAQSKYRYARVGGEASSWLIDQNPTLPTNVSGWLLQEILDIEQSRVQSVTITHDDGETIRIVKENAADKDFDVPDIPDGSELSYASVVDSIASVIQDLNLRDVAKVSEEAGSVKTVFKTFDGLEISIDSLERDDNTWITVNAVTNAAEPDPDDESEAGEADHDPEEASKINERVGGWTYQIQSYKGDQLRRRWSDILKSEE